MKKRLIEFYYTSVVPFFDAIFNLFIFLPYFFSVKNLLKTLFYPWKNLVKIKTAPGFNLEEIINCCSFNFVSRSLGFCLRSLVLISWLVIQILYLIILPFLIIAYIPFSLLLFSLSFFFKTQAEDKIIQQQKFLKEHLLKQENQTAVLTWFEEFYQQQKESQQWWKLKNLLLIPPLARDWAVGYTPILNNYCEDLTATEYQKKLPPVIIRQTEINLIENALLKSEAANLVIVGEAGVGKHTLIDTLAKKIYLGNTYPDLAYKRVLKINLEKVMNKYTDQKQRENFFEELLEEAETANNIILLINNLERYNELINSLEKFVQSQKLHVIGITTPFAYQKFLFNNEKINRYFTKIDISEVTPQQAEKILLNKVLFFEKKQKVVIPYETIKEIIEKSDYYLTTIPFPEKALVILDSACVYAKNDLHQKVVKPEIINTVISQITHAPTLITAEMKNKLQQLETVLKTEIIGQEQAINQIIFGLKRAFISLGKRKKPLASFLFVGPTGVGKTQTAKIISEVVFGKDKEILRFDMANYQSKNDIANLIGSLENPTPGLLTQKIRQNPFAILLLDEIEKADKELLHIFLSLLDEGYFTDGWGKNVDGKNLIIIATSNAASKAQFKEEIITDNQLLAYLIDNNYFSPEFLNRFDGIIFFHHLPPNFIKEIIRKLAGKISWEIYHDHQVQVEISADLVEQIFQKQYSQNSQEFGARHLERAVREEIGNKIANLIFANKVKAGDKIII